MKDHFARKAAANNANIRSVVNLSIGDLPRNETLNTMAEKMVNAGIVIVAAAGNSAADACDFSPASSDKVITVAALSVDDHQQLSLANYTNFGKCVDVIAPGTGVYGPYYGDTSSYISSSGTSQATPHVSGVVARILTDMDLSGYAP